MSHKNTLLSLAVGTAFAAGAALSPLAHAADTSFGLNALGKGYQLAAADTKADAPAEKAKDGSCGAKMKDGSCGGEKKKEGSCGDKKKDGSCGEKKAEKKKDGKCGEGKCGANKKKAMEEAK